MNERYWFFFFREFSYTTSVGMYSLRMSVLFLLKMVKGLFFDAMPLNLQNSVFCTLKKKKKKKRNHSQDAHL